MEVRSAKNQARLEVLSSDLSRCIQETDDYVRFTNKRNIILKDDKMNSELKVSSLINFADYQEGTVISRTLIKKETGTVTLFAFDQGQGLSEHTAPFDALVCVLDGEVEIMISGNPYVLKTGEMIILPVNEPHSLKAVRRFKMMLTMIRS